MTIEDRLARLEAQMQDMADRQAILDCIMQNSRGNDRFDAELTAGSYHADGMHQLGNSAILGSDYGEAANKGHAALCEQCQHHITNHLVEIDGDVAHADTYVLGMFLNHGRESAQILSGRYIDRLEKRDGEWKIVVRRTTVEVAMEGPAALFQMEGVYERGYIKGARDKSDLSYVRPLTMDGGEAWEA